MRTVYLGTSTYAATVLEALAASKHRPQLVVSMPDSKQGRGRKLKPPPVAAAARSLEIELIQPESVNGEDCLQAVAAVEPEVVCVCAYGQLVKEPLLSEYLMLNVHPSLLPRWRGAAPIERAIIEGDAVTGVTIMRLTASLDSGPIALQQEVSIAEQSNYGDLSTTLADIGASLLVSTLDQLAAGQLTFTNQDDHSATYAEKVASSDRRLNLKLAATEVVNWIRGLTPHIGAYLQTENGERLKVIKGLATDRGELTAGQVLREEGQVFVGCGSGTVELIEVQPAGGRPMPIVDFLRGHQLPIQFEL